ncbi:hypothetical protein HHX47_DHR8000063 [Lentinula edodes]|nr:hypothetical protein HHX47_DHR8000063 [Lentinula edodes]
MTQQSLPLGGEQDSAQSEEHDALEKVNHIGDSLNEFNSLPERSYYFGHHTQSSISVLSDNLFFIPTLTYTKSEESKVVRILDTRLFPWVLLTTFVLNMDRTNLSNAVSDNLPEDLGFTTDTVNLGTAIYSFLFSLACLGGAVACKIVHPSRWIPLSMFCWGLVTMSHALIKDKGGYLAVIAVTEGGVIPATLIYLGSFYRSTELATRLAWFWGVQTIASAVSGLMASGLLQLRGVSGLEGWKWLFLVDGIITVVVAILTWFYLPRNTTLTKGGIRGWKPWFDERQVRITVTRIVRDDPSKRLYEQRVHWADVKDTATDLGLWGHLIITAVGLTPTNPLNIESERGDFMVPSEVNMTEPIKKFTLINAESHRPFYLATWQLVGWILLRCLPSDTSKGVKSIGKRTLASGCVIFAANIYGVWGSQIYRAKDAPDYHTGNIINIVFAATAVCLWFIQKSYYRYRNAKNERIRAKLSEAGRKRAEMAAEVEGNKSVLFRFTT